MPSYAAPALSASRLPSEPRLPALLRCEPVSRHMRYLLYGLAVLLIVLEVGGLLLGPTLEQWFMADPAFREEMETAQQEGLTETSPLVGLALTAMAALLTVGFAWQPSVAALLVLIGGGFGLLGLVGDDHTQLNTFAFAGGLVVGSAMVARYSRPLFAYSALGALALLVTAAELLVDGSLADDSSLAGGMTMFAVLGLVLAVPSLLIRRARRQVRVREAALREAQERVEQATEAERQRIATELHDVVAHGLTVISMQAAMLRTTEDPIARSESERTIETAARQSLVDLRRMLTALRGTDRNLDSDEDGAVADLGARLDELEGRLTAAGFQVDRRLDGLAELPRSMELTVLRILQEATTNVLKHAPRCGAVHMHSLHDDSGRLVLEVSSPLAAAPEEPSERERAPRPRWAGSGAGFGLAGMRERVALFGGTLRAEALGSRWLVRAVLPTR